MTSVLDELKWRGLFQQMSDPELENHLSDGPATVYCGFDPTAQSLHVGNLAGLMVLAHLSKAGHKAITLIGGATGMIGDPSGKDEERQLANSDKTFANATLIERQIRDLNFPEPISFAFRNNQDWMHDRLFIPFIRNVGKHFRVNQMVQKSSVRDRLDREQGISFTEFTYQIIQAHDFKHLHEHHNCTLQIGGSDQWGNITAGIDLIRRTTGQTVYGLSFPLLTDASGKKIGKSDEGKAVYLSPHLTSPYEFYQYWVNRTDEECGKLLRWFTFLSRSEIEAQEALIDSGENRGEVQELLAREVTALVHGQEASDMAGKASQIMFGGEPVENLTDDEIDFVFGHVPSTIIDRENLCEGVYDILDLFVATGLQPSKSSTRRLIKQNGAYLNNECINEIQTITEKDLASDTMLVLRSGKKTYHVVRFE